MKIQMHRCSMILLAAALVGCDQTPAPRDSDYEALFRPVSSSAESSSTEDAEDDEPWATATEPRDFQFPRDHGAHPDYRIEWWYYTGNLVADDGQRFGYQLTFFRTGLNRSPENPSRWAVRDLYTAHFAVSDMKAKQHRFYQRNTRAGVGLAGAEPGRLEVWNGDWRLEARGETHHLVAAGMAAENGIGIGIDLQLLPTGPPIPHGDGGLSQKGAAEGNASYYYSFPKMETSGTVTIDGEPCRVTGESWMDHEFSTSFLEPGQRGWDWFSIQFDDDTQLMLYQMRRDGGGVDPYSSGTFVDATGRATPLAASDFRLTPTSTWRSPATGGEYPLRWTLEVPRLGLSLESRPAFESQEMVTSQTTGIAYWEGGIVVTGKRNDAPLAGRGYLELTGYTGVGLGSLLAD